MRLSTIPRLALALSALLAAACQQDTMTAPEASCRPTGTACGENADCCSYGCVQGTCTRNPLEGGMCKNSDDCTYPRVCVANHCTSEVQCRVDGDTCDFANDCCSGLCRLDSNTCAPDQAPIADAGADAVEVPRHVSFTLPNASVDPDGTTIEYTWTLAAPAGSSAVLSSTTVARPSFTPDVTGRYEVTLTVSDGFLSDTDVVIVTAINTAPTVALTVPASQSRNVQFTAQGIVSDADGDPLLCSWTVTPPGGLAQPAGTPGSCTAAVTLPVTCGATPADEGDWVVTLTATDGVNTTPQSRTVTCVNDPPLAEAGPARAVNVGKVPEETPAVTTLGSASDVNGDTDFTWSWTIVSTPTGAVTALTGADTANASFFPDELGDYVLRATVCDRVASCTSDTVTVTAYPHIHDLGHAVADAEYAAGKIVMVGADPSTAGAGRLWTLDPASLAETSVALATAPKVVGVLASGSTAAVGDDVWLRALTFSANPPVTASHAFDVGDIAAASAKRVFVFRKATSTGQYVGELDTASGGFATRVGMYGSAGAADPTRTDRLYVFDPTASRINQWDLQPSGDVVRGYDTAPGCSSPRLWVAQNGAHLFSSCNAIYSTVDTMPKSPKVFAGVSSVRHLHAAPAGEVALLAADGKTIHRYDASFDPLTGLATETIPVWAEDSTPYPAEGDFVFIASDGSRNAIVRATVGGTTRFGLVRFGP